MQRAAFSSCWAPWWGVFAMLQSRAPVPCAHPSAHNSFVGALFLSASSFWQQSPGRHSTGAWSVSGDVASLPVKLRLLQLLRFQWDFALDVILSVSLLTHQWVPHYQQPHRVKGCALLPLGVTALFPTISSGCWWNCGLVSFDTEAYGFAFVRVFFKFAAVFCSLGWKMQTYPCKLVFYLGRCDFFFWGGVVFLFWSLSV